MVKRSKGKSIRGANWFGQEQVFPETRGKPAECDPTRGIKSIFPRHIAYLILWIRPMFNEGCPVFICNIFHWRCLGDFIVSRAFKVSFSKAIPILSQSRLKNMSACLFSCIIFRIQLEPHLLKKECESY